MLGCRCGGAGHVILQYFAIEEEENLRSGICRLGITLALVGKFLSISLRWPFFFLGRFAQRQASITCMVNET